MAGSLKLKAELEKVDGHVQALNARALRHAGSGSQLI